MPENLNIDNTEVLKIYLDTWNSGKYSTVEEMNTKFPELKGYDPEVLKIYLDTWNSGKYSTVEDMNLKFPEFFPVKKKVGAEPSGVSQSPFNGKGAALLPTTKSQGIPLLTKEDDTTPNFLPEAVVDFEKYTKGLPKGSKKPSTQERKQAEALLLRYGIDPTPSPKESTTNVGASKLLEKQMNKITPPQEKEKIKDLAEPAALLASAINNTKKIDAKAQWEKITPTAQIEYDGYVQQGGTLPIEEYAKERIVELETTDFVGNEIKARQSSTFIAETPEGTPSNTTQLTLKALSQYPEKVNEDIGGYVADYITELKKKNNHAYLIYDNTVKRINSGEVKWDVPGITMHAEYVGVMRDLKIGMQNRMQVDMSILSKSITDFGKKYKDHKPLMDSIQAKVADIEHYTSIVNAASVEGATPEQIAEAQRIEPLYKKAHGEYQKLMTTYTTLFDKKSVEKYNSDLAAYKQLQQKYNSLPYYFSKYDKEYQNVTNLIGDFNTATGAKDVVVDVIYSSLDQLANALKSTTNFITQAPYRAAASLTDIEFLDNLVLSFDANTKYKNIHQVSSGFFQDQVGYLPMKELSIEQKKDLARYNPGVDIEKLKPSDFVKTPLDKWKPVNFVATIAATIGEMYLLPNKMSAAVSTMTGASRATAMTSLMYMRSYEDNYSRMLNTEGLSDGERVWLAATLSAMEGLSEQIMPDYKLFDKGSLAKNLVMAYSRGGKAEALRAGSKILLQTAEENLEEQAVLFGTAGLEAITNSLKGREIFEPQDLMGEAVNTALITSAVMGVLGAGGTYRVAKQFFDPANMDAQNLVYLSHDSQFKELPQILNELELGGEITAQKRNEITTMVANIREIKSKLPESLSENFTAIKLMAERNELLSQLKPVDKADFMNVNKDLNHEISLVEKELERMSALAEYQYRNIKEVNYFTEKENGKNVYFKQESGKEKEKITQKEFRDDIARLKSFGATLTNKGGLVTFEEVRDKINVYRSETTEALRKKIEEIRYGTVAEGKGKKRGKNKVIPLKLSEARRRQLLSEVIDKLNPEFRQRATPIVETALRELEAGKVSADSIKRLTKSLAQSQQFANMDEVRYNQSTQSFEGIKAGTVVRSIALNQISGNTEWINPFAMQEDTLVHELAAHPYVSTMAMEAGTKDGKLFNFADEAQRDSEYERLMSANLNDLNPQAQILRKGFALIHNTEYISRVESAGYSGKFGLYEEALVQAIGDYGAAMNTEEKRQSFLDIIKDLIKWLGGKAFKNRGLNPREFRNMDIKTYLAAITSDITTTPGVAPAKLGIRKGRMNFQVGKLSSSESFFNDADKIFPNDHILGGYAVTNSDGKLIGRIKLSKVNDNTVKIDEVVSEKRGQRTGNGSTIMKMTVENADKNNVTLTLIPNNILSIKAEGFETPQKLQLFYEKFGFIKDKGKASMTRLPNSVVGGGVVKNEFTGNEVFYHGAKKSFDKFEKVTKAGQDKDATEQPIFLSEDKEFADANAIGKDATTMEVKVKNGKYFDFRKDVFNKDGSLTPLGEKIRDAVDSGEINLEGTRFSDYDGDKVLNNKLSTGDYDFIEKRAFIDWLKKEGYDGTFLREHPSQKATNLAVWNTDKLEINKPKAVEQSLKETPKFQISNVDERVKGSVVGGEVKFGTAFDMQDATAENTVGKEKGLWGKAQVWRERIENAGDILRELSSRGDKPDVKYLMEKVKKLRDWIAKSKKGYTPIDKSIKTIEDFEKTSLRWSDAVDSREYIEKFHSNILDRIRSEYEAIPTYTKEQRLAVELVIDLINNNIKGLESKLNEIENISNQIKSNGKLPIIADIKLGKAVEQSLKETTKFQISNVDERVKQYDGIFNPKTTGISGLDDLLQDDGYNYFYKGVTAEVVMMSPDEYLQRVREGLKTKEDTNVTTGKKSAITEAINKGNKINMPFISTKDGKFSQEGRNRAVVAKEKGEKLIPVLIEKDVTFSDKLAKGKDYVNSAIASGAITKEEVLAKLKEQGLHRDAIRFIDTNFEDIGGEQPSKFQISGTQYTFTGEEKDFEGITVRRIKYGDTVGGWIEFEDNIQGGKVLGDAVVIGDAMVMDDAVVAGKAVIDGTEGRVVVAGTSLVSGDVSITGTVDIDGETMITGHVSINADNLFIKSSTISGNVSIDLQGLANLDGEYIVGTYGINDLADITQETTEAQSFIRGIHNRLRGAWSNVQGFVNRSAEDISSEDIQNISLKSLIERLPITEDDKKIIEDSTKSAMVTGEYKILEDETIIDRINHKVRNIDIIPKNGDIDRQIDALTKSLESMPQNKLKDLVRLRLSDLHATKFLREKWVKEMQSRPGFESTVKDLAIVSDVNDYGTMTRYLVDAEGNSYGNMSVSAHGFVITAAIKRAYHGDTELGSKNKLAEALYRGITNGMIATTGARLKSDGTFQATEYINPKTGLKEERFRAKDFWEKLIKYGYAEIDERGNYVALFQIIGEQGAQYLPKISNDLNIAQAMERDLGLEIDYWDVPDKEQLKKMYKIRLATGWERGKDGLWRYELDPIKLKFSTKEGLRKVLEGKPVMSEGAIRVPLSEIIDTKPFGQHYNLDDVFVYFDPYENTYDAHYANNAIGVSLALRSIDSGVTVLKSVLSHEIQHHIQKKEGFSMGGGISVDFTLRRDIEDTKAKIRELKSIKEIVNEKDIPNYDLQISELETKLNDFVKLYDQITDEDEDKLYFKSYEEVETRNVQNRIGMTKGERIATLLRHTEDVAPEHQVLIPEVTFQKSLTEFSENMVVIMSKILGRGFDKLSDTDIKSRYEQFMSEIEEAEGYTPTTRALRAMEDDIIDNAVKFQLIYHSGDGVLTEWDESRFKGGSRGTHGWGMYFSSSQYKAQDYGKIKAVFDDADFNFFDLDKKVTEEAVRDLAIRIGGEEAWKKRRYYIDFNTGNDLYNVILEKLLDTKGRDFDTARKMVLNTFKWDANKRYAEMLVAAGYDAVSEDNGYYFVIINGQKYNEVYNKYKELGEMPGGVKFQVEAYHGSPYSFDKFSLDKMGTGEGAQAFGWGLYFTDLESIAKGYAESLAKQKQSYLYKGNIVFGDGMYKTTPNEALEYDIAAQIISDGGTVSEFSFNKATERLKDYFKADQNETAISKLEDIKFSDFSQQAPNKNLYKVTLHKGKTPDQYTWLEWDKPVSRKVLSDIINNDKTGDILDALGAFVERIGGYDDFSIKGVINTLVDNYYTGGNIYSIISDNLINPGDKNASTLLLTAGIDGIKYPAESIARKATSDTARGFNYVVFDENAITIEEVVKFQMTSPITPDVTNKVLNQLDKEGYPIKSFSRKIVVYNSTDIYIDDKGSMGDLYSDVIFPIFKTRTEALRFLNRAGINLSVPAEVKFAIQPTIPTNEIRQVVKEGMDMMYTPELIRNEIIKIYNLKRKADIEALDVVMDEVYHDKTGKYMVLKNRRSARKAIKNNRGDMYVAETIHDIAERWNQMSDIDKEVVKENASITPGDLASKAFKMVELRLDGKEETEEYLTLYEEMKNAGTQIGKALNIFKLFSVGAQSKEKTLNDRFKLYGKKLPDNVKAEFKKLFKDIEDLTREIKMGSGVLNPIDILIKEADLEKLTRRQDLLWAQYNPEQTSMLRLFDAGKGNLFKIVTMGVNLVSNVVSNITNIAIFTPVSLIRGKAGHVLTKSDLVFGVRKGLPLTIANIVENYKYGTYSSTSEIKVGGFGSHQMLRYFNPFIEAVGATFETYIKGTPTEEVAEKYKMLLTKTKSGDLRITKRDIAKKIWMGTVGANSDIMLRTLVTGDAPFTNTVYLANLKRLARKEGITDEKKINDFITNAPHWAHEVALELAKTATFTQENPATEWIGKFKKSLLNTAETSTNPAKQFGAGAAYITTGVILPFTHVPLNFVYALTKMMAPTVYFADMAVIAGRIKQYDTSIEKEMGKTNPDRNRIEHWNKKKREEKNKLINKSYEMGAVIAVHFVFKLLAMSGAFAATGGDDDKEFKKKQLDKGEVNTVNFGIFLRWINHDRTKIWVPKSEPTDFKVNISKLGLLGIVPTVFANNYHKQAVKLRARGQEYRPTLDNTLFDIDSMLEMLTNITPALQESLQLTFVQSISKIFAALGAEGESGAQKAANVTTDLVNTVVTQVMFPNNAVGMFQANRDYIPASNKRFGLESYPMMERFENLLKNKVNIKGQTIMDEFGNDIPQTPKNFVWGDGLLARWMYHNVSITKITRVGDEKNLAIGMYQKLDDYMLKATDNGIATEPFPITLKDANGISHNMTPEQYQKYCKEMGKIKELLVQNVFNTPGINKLLTLADIELKANVQELEDKNLDPKRKAELLSQMKTEIDMGIITKDGKATTFYKQLTSLTTGVQDEVRHERVRNIINDALWKNYNKINKLYDNYFVHTEMKEQVSEISPEVRNRFINADEFSLIDSPEIQTAMKTAIETIQLELTDKLNKLTPLTEVDVNN